ncbi:uncharacterized protein CTRU02_211373, partial [Colletotrichum truncatum]
CWTCKKRKVKCDERPSSCGNCLKIKVPCGGYGIRLQWINISNPFRELNKAQRTNSSGGGRIKIGTSRYRTYLPNTRNRQVSGDSRCCSRFRLFNEGRAFYCIPDTSNGC